jgi:hypothetical protein
VLNHTVHLNLPREGGIVGGAKAAHDTLGVILLKRSFRFTHWCEPLVSSNRSTSDIWPIATVEERARRRSPD